jgi:Fe-S cluster assembly ATP-binding protein
MLKIEDLSVSLDDGTQILKKLSLSIKKGEIHAVMGPNGSGKSTLSKVLAGDPSYLVTGGSVSFKGEELLDLEPNERVNNGLFMTFQYPLEIQGVTNFQLLYSAYNNVLKYKKMTPLTKLEFESYLDEKMKRIKMKPEFKQRNVNEGFSGGEKKRNEILQMAVLNPELSILDETDSGLDIDALRIVSDGVNSLLTSEKSLLLITHYQRILNYIKPDFIHVLMNGQIVKSGGPDLALKLEEQGYDWLL